MSDESRPVYAVDFECYYDSEVSLKPLGVDGYTRHPMFDAYMVSVVGTDGTRFCGHPRDFDWQKLHQAHVVSHNASFDSVVASSLMERGSIPRVYPFAWDCTADLVAYLGVPRSLKSAMSILCGVDLSKDTRDAMKGKQWDSMSPEFRAEVLEYALKDSEYCLRLWQEFSPQWPEHERRISRLTRTSAARGIMVDRAGLEEDIASLTTLLESIEVQLPWVPEHPILSAAAFGNCVRASYGVAPPASLAKDNAELAAWCEENPGPAQWVELMQQYRSANALREKLFSIQRRIRPDGTIAAPIKYFGAHTGRDSGADGVNFQNLPREAQFGVHLRKRLVARPGHTLIVADLANIEPRSLSFLAGDREALEYARTCTDFYEAQARAWGLYDGELPLKEGAPNIRHMVKSTAIGAGYCMSAKKFAMVTGKPLSEAQAIIDLFRRKNPKVLKLWDTMHRGIAQSRGGDYEVKMPSGRTLRYRSVAFTPDTMGGGAYSALFPKETFVRLRIWKGTAVENCLSGDTPVLTDRGWVPMVEVSLADRVWDGEQWVCHEGLVFKGQQPVVSVLGVRATLDHKFLCRNEWRAASECCDFGYRDFYTPESPGPISEMQAPPQEHQNTREVSRTEAVYDLVNAGPRHRFTVMSDCGPLVVSNCTQAFARDVFMAKVLEIEDAGYPVLLRVHDEVVAEVPDGIAEAALKSVKRIMETPVSFAKGLPLAASVKAAKVYAEAK